MSETMLCPRRPEAGSFKLPESDGWKDCRCTFCGSLHPDDAMNLIEAGHEVGPTDKNYKIYIDGHLKFYFQHFSREQKMHFVDLLNAKKINVGYPGRFYVLPYFIERG